MTRAASLADQSARDGVPERRTPSLTPRQMEVMRLLSAGRSNKFIAQRLGITPGTVKLHVAGVLRAMGLRTRRDLQSSRAEAAEVL